ncbi:MAG TPA: hypothetical protein VN541_07195, partial [Tepidisphaeraceae bacterium]|nr:hypothetical protein [Tepidisphaeraceae bacterium]
EHMIVDGPIGYLKGLMIHDDRRGLEPYIAKHNRYSTLEAEAVFRQQQEGDGQVKASLFGDAIQRKRFIRERIYPKLPAKWFFRFLYMYFFKLGILDGMTGLRFCLFISSYELFISLKLAELQRVAKEARQGGAP